MALKKEAPDSGRIVEFAKNGDRTGVVMRGVGFARRFSPGGLGSQQSQRRLLSKIDQQNTVPAVKMATESPLIHDGSQSVLSTGFDFRNSTLSGSTLAGPNGSGQFLLVTFSTGRTLQPFTSTMLNLSTLNAVYGVCQNKPRAGDAVDVGIFGVTKMVSASTSITGGTVLQASSTSGGAVVPFVGGNGNAVGIAIENATSVGQVFTAFIGGVQVKSASS